MGEAVTVSQDNSERTFILSTSPPIWTEDDMATEVSVLYHVDKADFLR